MEREKEVASGARVQVKSGWVGLSAPPRVRREGATASSGNLGFHECSCLGILFSLFCFVFLLLIKSA